MSESTEPKFEDVISKLETLVAELETGGLPLDRALSLYEEGVKLARRGHGLLEGAENRIEELQKSLQEPEAK